MKSDYKTEIFCISIFNSERYLKYIEYIRQFPASGEINSKVNDPEQLMARIESLYQSEATSIDYTDGLSINFSEWRFNVRKSNTEPIIRIYSESTSKNKADKLAKDFIKEIKKLI